MPKIFTIKYSELKSDQMILKVLSKISDHVNIRLDAVKTFP